ncbi:MAG: hypothetical protein ABR585_13620 [Gemmatimonadaceae bacterium]|nr:hypothetical protein [Actinomycetota bacterium]
MTEYGIRIEEEFYEATSSRVIASRTCWEVYSDQCTIDKGLVEYGGPIGEKEARKRAEKAATLHAKQEAAKAKIVTYEFTPEI